MAVPARRAKSAVPRRNPPRSKQHFLNIGEEAYSDPQNRRARFHTAAGSAGETLAAVRTAVAWGIITRADGAPAAALLDQILPILCSST